MQTTKTNNTSTENILFLKDVEKGLSAKQKYLPSKYFYDEKGDALFIQIMNMPEYYLTNAELDIFKNQTDELITALDLPIEQEFDLIELGAGDGTKTKNLLKALNSKGFKFTFIPIDISQNALNNLENSVKEELPEVKLTPKQGHYFNVLNEIKLFHKPKVVLFLGSNIGNLEDNQAIDFMTQLNAVLEKNDKVVLGVDLIKPEHIVLPAYNDSQGITKQFNLNLLQRINKELGGSFILENFEHLPEYDENKGIAKSYLVSKIDQTVLIKALDKTYHFSEGEKIYTETSRKYNSTILKQILDNTQLEISHKLTDSKNYFADYILKKTSD
ncbi:L-histidine N(alpha)-methyltransferase [Hanstruepera ponticola]|uniref:L-histidine N(alpha)-methyltransferase n=1 Tax=Hanstruepera ponticola TaxID=2042995 RepID=UPI000CF11EFE|nr:L-histidine N(alpha)-methyltransferase [Hanstruepera ponticola]